MPEREYKLGSVASHMKHIALASSNDDGGTYPILGHHQFVRNNTPSHHQNMPLFHQSRDSFSLLTSPQQDHGHCTSLNQPLPLSQATPTPPSLSEPHRGEADDAISSDYSNYLRYTSSVNQGFGSSYVGIPTDAPIVSCTSPETLLDVLSEIQLKVQQLQAVVQSTVQGGGKHGIPQQQQSLAAGVTSIMSQLFAATAGLLQQQADSSIPVSSSAPQPNQTFDLRFDSFHDEGVNNPLSGSLGSFMGNSHESSFPPGSSCSTLMGGVETSSAMRVGMGGSEMGGAARIVDQRAKEQGLNSAIADHRNPLTSRNAHSNTVETDFAKGSPSSAVEAGNCHPVDDIGNQMMCSEDHGYSSVLRDDEDDGEGENLPPGSYELVEMAAAEILAEHAHFCEICGKGFKRDANLRMHMRGHGDEYKTPSALARPDKTALDPSMVKLRRYSCPYVGCKRNKKHQKFQPLKTMLCVKNHYRRSHCPKVLTCSKCKTKKFSVVADLKTHEKHCGRYKWQCSCQTTFSRKDKLLGHISLFAGHTPAVPMHEMESFVGGIESSSGYFSSGCGEGLEALAGNKAVLGTAGSANVAQKSVSEKSATLMTGSSHGMDMTDVSVMGKGIHRTDGYSQQSSAHRGEKNLLLGEPLEGTFEVMQHCG